jgi:hypothetical protein
MAYSSMDYTSMATKQYRHMALVLYLIRQLWYLQEAVMHQDLQFLLLLLVV